MSLANLYQTIGLSFAYSNPLILGGRFIDRIAETLTAYDHENLANGGYWTATLTIQDRLSVLSEWIEHGLGRDIDVIDDRNERVWKGFVNHLTLTAGGQTAELGPLVDIGNRVLAVYAPLDTSVYPPVTHPTTETVIAEDFDSQGKYGIIEKILSAGTCTDAEAQAARDLYLAEMRFPNASGGVSLSPGSAGAAVLTLSCLGYVYWLEAYVYNNTTLGVTTASNKIITVLGAETNSIVSADYSQIEPNAILVAATETENRTGLTIIKAAVMVGDINDIRYNFGLTGEQVAYYRAVPADVEYIHVLHDPAQRVEHITEGAVRPWAVKPGKWLAVPDFMVGRHPEPIDLRLDQRVRFLESVRYTAPYSVDLQGGRVTRLPQALAKIGVGGIF